MKTIYYKSILILFFLSNSAYANVVINATRAIFPSDKNEISLRIQNENKLPVLVQTWVDDGNAKMSSKMPKTPFTILPPMFRMEPNEGQALRIMYNGESLANDRESVYWINVFEVPPSEANVQGNNLQLAFRSRIKLFFRPITLPSPKLDNLVKDITCKIKVNNKSQTLLTCHNASPYFISFSNVSLKDGNKLIPLSLENFGMIQPFGDVTENIKGTLSGNEKFFQAALINDQGGVNEKKIKVSYEQ